MMTDTIADMLTRIRNAVSAGHGRVEFPASRLKANICKVLKEEGHIKSFKIVARGKVNISLSVVLKEGAIVGIERFSRPGLRQYRGYRQMPRVLSGLGTSVISTSQGVMSSREAKRRKLGGEILCHIW